MALGAGDIVSNATAGATFGYHLIWALGMTLIFRFVWVNTSAKYVLVTGESLFTGYGRLGHWVVWVIPKHKRTKGPPYSTTGRCPWALGSFIS